jgi:hypothetical protein
LERRLAVAGTAMRAFLPQRRNPIRTTMKDGDIHNSDPQSLTQMLSLDAGDEKLWSPEELGAILEHQLSAPLECDLARLDRGLARCLRELNFAAHPESARPLQSFRDLLSHPSPPLRLLELTKQFAKACRNDPQGPLPDEIATVLYFSSIVVAMTRCGQRITKMDDRSLEFSLNWALRQPWLDQATRQILLEGLSSLGPAGADGAVC